MPCRLLVSLTGGIAALLMMIELAAVAPAYAQARPSASTTTSGAAPAQPRDASTAGVVNIRDFGAKCDGTTDDYAVIAAALAHAGQSAGGVLFFPPSPTPCLLSRALKARDNVTLRAAAATVTLKAAVDNMSRPVLLEVGNNVRIEGLSFDGGGRDHPNTQNVIVGFKVSNVVFDQIAVRHTRGIGLVLSSSIANSAVQASVFEDLGNHWKTSHDAKDRIQGVVFCCGTGNHGNTATHNQFSDIGLDALQFADQSEVTVTDNRFDLTNGQHSVVDANDFPAAIFLLRVNGAKINGNVIIGAQGSCIDAPGVTNAEISHNTITECAAAGIGLFDTHTYSGPFLVTDHVTVSGNTITNTGRWAKTPFPGGITLGGRATNVSMTGNKISDTQRIKTQNYGVFGTAGSTVSGLLIDPSNSIQGNAKSAVGGTAGGH